MSDGIARRHVFIDAAIPKEGVLSVTGDARHHLVNVLRMRSGEQIVLRGARGAAFLAEIVAVDRAALRVRVTREVPSPPAPPCHITVAQAPGRGDRFERVLQHCTEIGVSAFVPILSDRTVPEWQGPALQSKMRRWAAILRSSAEQARRDRVPDLMDPCSLDDVMKLLSPDRTVLLLEGVGAPILEALDATSRSSHWALVAGPEGGFTADEKARLEDMGAIAVTLGPYVLRTETAALAASSVIMAYAATH
jgi:16S rRNA (uracil1498-N3)-methyltransferase